MSESFVGYPKHKRVSMVVWNTVEQDARVRKEAQTLAREGYEVTVFGLLNPGVTPRFEVIEDRFIIQRVQRLSLAMIKGPKKPSSVGGVLKAKRNAPKGKSYLGMLILVVSRSMVHLTLAWNLMRSKGDAIHAHDINTLPTAWIAARLSRAKLVYDAHEVSTGREGYQKIRKYVAVVEKFLMPRADATITTTRLRAAFFSKAYKIAKPVVLQNLPRIEASNLDKRDTRNLDKRDTRNLDTRDTRDTRNLDTRNGLHSLLKLEQDWPIILYQGGLQQGRGLFNLLACAGAVKNTYFVFIGGGRLEPDLKREAEKSAAHERIYFVPTVPHDTLSQLTASADIGVQPLENTCFNHFSTDSNKLFEYMHAGLAIVSSNFPIIKEVIEHSDCGILVPAGDVAALGEAISKVAKNKKLRKRMQENALSAREQYCWEGQEEVLLQLYRQLSL